MMDDSIHILHLEDDPMDAELVLAKLVEFDFACRITLVQERNEFEQALRNKVLDIILADYRLPLFDGVSALRLTLELCPDVPFIFVSGTMGEDAAIEALTKGATDYVLKHNLSRLPTAVRRALREARTLRERREARKALQSSNEMLRAIIEAAPVAIIGLDLEGYVRSVWNPAAEKMLGWSAEEVMGQPLPSVPTDGQEEFCGFRHKLLSGMSLDGVEVCRKRRDGTPIDCSIYASPLKDDKGRIRGNISVLVDITERKRAEYALRESEAKYIDLYDNAPDMYVLIDAHSASIEKCNQTLADALGCSKEEIIGRPVFDIYHPDCQGWAKEAFQEFLAIGEVHDKELQLRTKDGSKLDVSLNASAVRTGDGTIVFSRATLRDITEKRRNRMINAARIRLMQFAGTHSLDELLEETVNEAENLTESLIGFYHFVDDNQKALTLQNWSTRTKAEFCRFRGKGLHYPVADAGVWVDCVRQGKPVVHNDYKSLSHRKGLPEGHADVLRELVVPVMRGGKIKAILGVGNKPADYSQKDVEDMSLLADIVWEITERKQAEQQVALMSFAMNGIHEIAFMIDENARFQYVNEEACRILGYSREELLAMSVPNLNPDLALDRWFAHWTCLKKHGALTFEGLLKTKTGRMFPVEVNANYFEYEGRSFDFELARDITGRKQAERERLENLRFFESMDRVNRAIQGADDLEDMMKDLLEVVISIYDCDRAYLMYPCDPESPTWSCPMERSKPEYPGLLDSNPELPMDPQVAETLRIMLAEDGPVAFGPGTPHELPEIMYRQFDVKCNMAMVVYPKAGAPWQFGLHQCSYARAWTAEETRMFEAIGRRLADGLSSLLSYRDLRKNEEFLDSIVEHIPAMIFVKEARTLKFVRFNKAGEQLVGYSREELIGKSDYDFFPKEVADIFTAKDRQVLDSREMVDIPEETIRARNDEERLLHTKKIPLLDESGTPQYLLGISEDITERKLAAEALQEKNAFIRNILDSVDEGFIVVDSQYHIRSANRAYCDLVHAAENDVVGRLCYELLHKNTEPCFELGEMCPVRKTFATGKPQFSTHTHEDASGAKQYVELKTYPITDASGTVVSVIETFNDVTEKRKLEEQLIQAQKMESVGRLAGGVAHDFNNMLGVIIGYAELTLDLLEKDNPLTDNLKEIFNAAKRSGNLTRQLLAFARQQIATPKLLDLNETVEGMIKMLRRLIGEDIELAWRPGADLWPVKIDPVQIDQILVNLCVNARDAISGVGTVVIETGQATIGQDYCLKHPELGPGDFLLLSVSDDGHGMEKATLDNIFEPFFTTKERGKGTGLGLSTVYGIVKQNDGFINVYSKPGCGTSFRIYLPRHFKKDEKPEKENAAGSISQGHETILLVEDELAILTMTRLMLERLGYRVLTAATPSEAMGIAGKYEGNIHLLLTDVVMPEMNGYDLAGQMASLRPSIRHLFMSGYTGDSIARQGVLDAGIPFIQKPFTIKELSDKLIEVLGES